MDDVAAFVEAVPHRRLTGPPSYSPRQHVVFMPEARTFTDEHHFWATYLHELAHWTSKDLDRVVNTDMSSEEYGLEELVAELSSVFSCARLGLPVAERPDHAQYLQGWVRNLRAEPTILRRMASRAQAATEYLATFSEAREMEAAS